MSKSHWLLIIILAVNFSLNVWGIDWGLPERWHPDEVVYKAEIMYDLGSFDHNYHAYGSLPFYQAIIVSVWPTDLLQNILPLNSFEIRTLNTMLARLLSAAMATAIVYIIYQLGSRLFNSKAGLISAALTAFSMGLVNLAHFATPDIPSLFWSALAALYAVKTWQTGSDKHYILAGIFSGLAAAIRYVGGITIIVLLTAHWLRKKDNRSPAALIKGLAASFIIFFVGDFAALVTPCTFLIGFIKETFFNFMRNPEGGKAFSPLIVEYVNASGLPMALLSFAGLIYALWLYIKKREQQKPLLLIASMLVPYYLLVGGMNVSLLRYALPLQPFLLLLTGKMMADFLSLLPGKEKFVWLLLLAFTLTYSFFYVVAADLTIINDSRYMFNEWLRNNIDTKEKVEITSYISGSSHWLYPVTIRPHNKAEEGTIEALQDNETYHLLLKYALYVEQKAKSAGFCPEEIPTYTSWYENARKGYREEVSGFNISPAGLDERRPKWLAVSSLYYNRFFRSAGGPERKFFKMLFNNKLSYRPVQTIQYQTPYPYLSPKVEFVNPEIIIYRRQQ